MSPSIVDRIRRLQTVPTAPGYEEHELHVIRAGVHLTLGDDGTWLTDAVDDPGPSVIPDRGQTGDRILDGPRKPGGEDQQ